VNQTGRDSYLFHVGKAANWDLIAASHERKGFWRQAEVARDNARKHREKAALIDLERRAVA